MRIDEKQRQQQQQQLQCKCNLLASIPSISGTPRWRTFWMFFCYRFLWSGGASRLLQQQQIIRNTCQCALNCNRSLRWYALKQVGPTDEWKEKKHTDFSLRARAYVCDWCGLHGFEKAVFPHSRDTPRKRALSSACIYLNRTICKTLISRRYTYTSANVILIMLCSVFSVQCQRSCRLWAQLYARCPRYQPIIIFESTCIYTILYEPNRCTEWYRSRPAALLVRMAIVDYVVRRGKMQHTFSERMHWHACSFFPISSLRLRYFALSTF